MKRNILRISLLCSFLTLISLAGYADNKKVLSIYSEGQLTFQYDVDKIDYVEIEDVFIEPEVLPTGDGSEDNPFNIKAVQISTGDLQDVWVEGYVVGYVPEIYWKDAVFGNIPDPDSSNYMNGVNLILSSAIPGEADLDNSIPVQIPVSLRPELGISKNPEIFGKRVMLKGNIERYYGQRGLRQTSAYLYIPDSATPTAD